MLGSAAVRVKHARRTKTTMIAEAIAEAKLIHNTRATLQFGQPNYKL
jgi:hypothetical protein